MYSSGREIFGAIIAITLVVILLSALIVFVIVNYKRKQDKYRLEKDNLILAFENERIKIQTEVEEEIRQNLASELHDNIGQVMSLTNVILASIDMKDEQKAKEKISSAQELMIRSIREMRQLAKLVQGKNLLSGGLKQAIEQEVKWLERNDYYKVSCTYYGDIEKLRNDDKDLVVFRLLQESLQNIIKHADATAIAITVSLHDDLLTLEINDNGKGFDLDIAMKKKEGLGINNIRKRLHLLQGQMRFSSTPKVATILTFIIPYAFNAYKED